MLDSTQFIYLVILYPNNNSWLVSKDQQVHHNAAETIYKLARITSVIFSEQ